MIITISGKQGAGKTSVGKELAKRLGYKFISIGELRGEIATEKGLTIDELNKIGERESWAHKEADKKTIEIGKTKDNFIIEGWIAYHFIQNSKKIFLEVSEKIGAERIFNDQRKDEPYCKTIEEMQKLLKNRLNETYAQFKKYYKINFLDKSQYDIEINTTNLSINETADKLLKFLK
ncbi:MAG: cytidylate kinase family protein [Nanoarchaeota archaeon]